ncbi:MAG TPA: transcriptional repressor LexA [Candidatus Polarisedimenticolia bacterium]|jgi:repressor LexA|nr:transcriptional repressor LexA [Candidatus Polarisedimenticolia bacterium]
MSLTRRQRDILSFISRFLEKRGYAPSLKEIGAEFGLSSAATVHKHLAALEARGRIRRSRGRRRFVEVIPEPAPSQGLDLPLRGTLAAGRAIEASETAETLTVPAAMVRRRDAYVLRVAGNSMLDEQIRDGDYLVVEARHEATDGETVVALLDGKATLKRFYGDKGRVRLQSTHATGASLLLDSRAVSIEGVVTGLLRHL